MIYLLATKCNLAKQSFDKYFYKSTNAPKLAAFGKFLEQRGYMIDIIPSSIAKRHSNYFANKNAILLVK